MIAVIIRLNIHLFYSIKSYKTALKIQKVLETILTEQRDTVSDPASSFKDTIFLSFLIAYIA